MSSNSHSSSSTADAAAAANNSATAITTTTTASTAIATATSKELVKNVIDSNSNVSSMKPVGTFNGQLVFAEASDNPLDKPIPTNKAPVVSLEDDAYVQAMHDIIQRDFFPDLEVLRTKKEFYRAIDCGDDALATKLAVHLDELENQIKVRAEQSSSYYSGPGKGDSAVQAKNKGKESSSSRDVAIVNSATSSEERKLVNDPDGNPTISLNTTLTLDAFQHKYTSEDNASFEVLLNAQNELKKQSLSHFYPSEEKMLQITGGGPVGHITQGGEGATVAGLITGGHHLNATPINSWAFTPKNSLMYAPDGAPLIFADIPASRAGAKALIHSSTRIPSDIYGSASNSSPSTTIDPTEVWKKMNPGSYESDKPVIIEGWSMVPDTPDIYASKEFDATSEIMTWGMMESTPVLLDKAQYDPLHHNPNAPSFTIAPTPAREELGRAMAEKAATSLKIRAESVTSGASTRQPSTQRIIVRSGTPVRTTDGGVFKKPFSRLQSPALVALARKLTGSSGLAASLARAGTGLGNATPFGSALQASYSPAFNMAGRPGAGTPGRTARKAAAVARPSGGFATPLKNSFNFITPGAGEGFGMLGSRATPVSTNIGARNTGAATPIHLGNGSNNITAVGAQRKDKIGNPNLTDNLLNF